MKELLEYMARNLVENPDAVAVSEIPKEEGVTLELRVAPEDMGRVIGRSGRIAKDMRTILKNASAKENTRVHLEIIDTV